MTPRNGWWAVAEAAPSALAQGREREQRGMAGDRRPEGEPLLTVAEVAEILRVSNMTVYRLIKSGQIAALRVGKNYRIRRPDLEAYLSAGSVRTSKGNG